MASQVVRDLSTSAPPERLFDVIVDYERYPEFLSNVKSCRVKSRAGKSVDVELQVDFGVKVVRYTLRHIEERPSRVSWSLVSGEWMKVSNGSWDLTPEGEGTRARYTVELQIAKPALVPQALVDRATDEISRIQLPKMLEAFKARAERGG